MPPTGWPGGYCSSPPWRLWPSPGSNLPPSPEILALRLVKVGRACCRRGNPVPPPQPRSGCGDAVARLPVVDHQQQLRLCRRFGLGGPGRPMPLPSVRAGAAAVSQRRMAARLDAANCADHRRHLPARHRRGCWAALLPACYLPIAIGCVLAGLAALFARYRSTEAGVQKQQLKWVTLGLVVGIALILSARAGAELTAGMAMPMIGTVAIEGLFQLGIIVLALRLPDLAAPLPALRCRSGHQPLRRLCGADAGTRRHLRRLRSADRAARPALFRIQRRRPVSGLAAAASRPSC